MKKLSTMNFEEGALAVGTLSLTLSEILEDKTIDGILSSVDWKSFTKSENGKLTTDNGAIVRYLATNGAKLITKLIGLMCKSYFSNVVEILQVFTEKTEEEIKQGSIIDTMNDLKEIFKDEDFLKLFSSVQKETKN